MTGSTIPVVSDINDKVQHVLAFATLALLLDFSFPERPAGAAKLGSLLAYGIALELAQSFTTVRDPSYWDVAADALGLSLYLLSGPLLRRAPILQRRWKT
ncbi:MAG: hypothetical protein A2W29_02945 [Gemmatimonadetes bacterium RBG_16_66_8]|nr:MAG: hypothetical protein A2W29_02945 [Gemmatimonadetes bacterium RBG_16_66_8]